MGNNGIKYDNGFPTQTMVFLLAKYFTEYVFFSLYLVGIDPWNKSDWDHELLCD